MSAPPTNSTMLTVRGVKQVQDRVTFYQNQSQAAITSLKKPTGPPLPASIAGTLWKSGRTGSRYFEIAQGTPLMLYYRSKALAYGTSYPAHAAIDLTAASKIALLASNGSATNRFVIQAGSHEDPSIIEHVQLTAPSVDEARRWVGALLEIRAFFTHQKFTPSMKRPSQMEMVAAGKELFKQASFTMNANNGTAASSLAPISSLPALRGINGNPRQSSVSSLGSTSASFGQLPSTMRQVSLQSIPNDHELYFSASSDDEQVPESEPVHHYMRQQAKLDHDIASLGLETHFSFPETMWGRPGYDDIPLRGANYIIDHVKVSATRTLMRLVAVDCFSTGKTRVDHIASHPSNRLAIALKNGTAPPFTWVITVQCPGSSNIVFTLYFVPSSAALCKIFSPTAVDNKEAYGVAASHGLPPKYVDLVREFFFGSSDKFRNERFKLIPLIRSGPWLVRNAVPNKPALIGNKLTNRYFRGDGYCELDIDIASSSVANKLTQMSIGFSKSLVVDLAFVLEGRSPEELPEEVVGIASVVYADVVTNAVPLI